MKLRNKILLAVYQFFRTLRYNLLKSVFGIVSHCRHSETCGTYTFRKIEDDGLIIGMLKGLKQIITCW